MRFLAQCEHQIMSSINNLILFTLKLKSEGNKNRTRSVRFTVMNTFEKNLVIR